MNPIEYQSPTSRSFAGMKRILFQPFDIGKWFMLGFSAWLAGFLERGNNFSGGSGDFSTDDGTSPTPELESQLTATIPGDISDFIPTELGLTIGIIAIILIILIPLLLVLLWLGSRGKFMFLDNVVHNRALVQAPWAAYKNIGNSLFLWRLGFWLLFVVIIFAVIGSGAFFVYNTLEGGQWTPPKIAGAIAFGIATITLLLGGAYISIMLEDFVIPIMYKNSSTTTEAWRAFRSVHGGQFILYFLWKCLLSIVSGIGILLVAFGTCCIGLILMIIPYVGTVFLLPVSVFFRLLGPEFLRQFGHEYDIFEGNQPPSLPLAPTTGFDT